MKGSVNSTAILTKGVQGFQPLDEAQTWELVERRLAANSQREGGCLLFTGKLTYAGYGQISIRGYNEHAHRAAYKVWVGPIPEGLEIDHLCRVRHCIEPGHLEAVTHDENMRRRTLARTHCPRNHSFAEYGRLDRHGWRHCRECERILRLERRARLDRIAAASEVEVTVVEAVRLP